MITDYRKEALPFQTLVCDPAEDPGRGRSPARGAGHSGVLGSLGEPHSLGGGSMGSLPTAIGGPLCGPPMDSLGHPCIRLDVFKGERQSLRSF